MSKKKEHADMEPEVMPSVLEAVSEVMPEKAVVIAVDVLSGDGQVIRSYSLDVHGEDFSMLAAEFAAHTPGATVR